MVHETIVIGRSIASPPIRAFAVFANGSHHAI
jgi:hypothetical protein